MNEDFIAVLLSSKKPDDLQFGRLTYDSSKFDKWTSYGRSKALTIAIIAGTVIGILIYNLFN